MRVGSVSVLDPFVTGFVRRLFALSLVPSSTPSNVSAWSRQWDAEQAQRARRRTGYRP
jgi:hypothetical protein